MGEIVFEIEREVMDEDTQTLHIKGRIVEYDDKGNVIGKGELYQRGFCLPGESEDCDFDQEIEKVKEEHKQRYLVGKRNRERIKGAVEKKLKTKKKE